MSTAQPYIEGPVTRAQVESGAWVRQDELARALGVDARTVRRRVRAGRLERTELAGRVYVRQVEQPTPSSPEPQLALVVREQAGRLESLFVELTRARVEAARLEVELAQARERAAAQVEEQAARARQVEEQLAQAREQAAREQARAERLEALANAPWYAVRVRRQLRRELVSA